MHRRVESRYFARTAKTKPKIKAPSKVLKLQVENLALGRLCGWIFAPLGRKATTTEHRGRLQGLEMGLWTVMFSPQR